MENIAKKILKFEKKSWAMKPYAAFRWGENMPCPIRFVVNPYKGCDFRHKYCYVWYKCAQAKPKENFRKALLHDIERAKKLDLNNFFVMLSSSTDPFQPIEKKFKDSKFAMGKLLANNFSVLIMTRNPAILLDKEYIEFTKNPHLFIDVSIPSLYENNPDSIFYSPSTPSLDYTLKAMKKLTELGKDIRIKIEPVVPTINRIIGQSETELKTLISKLKNIGVKMVIAKTMRLNKEVPPFMYDKLIDYYKKNGCQQGINLILSKKIREKLLTPIFKACQKNDMPFCSCVETDLFPANKTVRCLREHEEVPSIMSIINDMTEKWKTEETFND
ncbi:hypothetical protein KKA66_03200 [Patescibacteria group bacterium]|nr:hypothetical protein [Patescibacteria group bacterium]